MTADFSGWRVLTLGEVPPSARAHIDGMGGIAETPLTAASGEAGEASTYLVVGGGGPQPRAAEHIEFLRRTDAPVIYLPDGIWPVHAAILLEARENWENNPREAASYLHTAISLCTTLGISSEIVACWNLVGETTLTGRVGLPPAELAWLKKRELAATKDLVERLARKGGWAADVPIRYFEGGTLRAANALINDGSVLAVFPYRLRKGLLRAVLGQSVTTFTYRNEASVASIPLWT